MQQIALPMKSLPMNRTVHRRFTRSLLLTALLVVTIGPQTVSVADDVLIPFDIDQVRVGGEIGRRIDVTMNNYLLVLDVENDFLAPFRAKTLTTDGYIGLDKLIDTAVRFAAYSKDKKALALKKLLIGETIGNQEPDGYIGMMVPPARMWRLWDIHEMSHIILGLTSDYRYCGQRSSLEAARKTADYILRNWSSRPDGWPPYAFHLCALGMNRSMLMLYRETKDSCYLNFCFQQGGLDSWDKDIVIGRHGKVEGHVYAYLTECHTQLELYRLQPEERLLRSTRRAIQFITAQDGMAISGGGHQECWNNEQNGGGKLGETSTTACQLRVYENLLRLEGNPYYGDLMERTIFNALFGAQSTDGRRLRYYTPLEGNREFFQLDTYCCPCNYRRIDSELPTMVYYRSGRGLTVNLYTPSTAMFKLDNGDSVGIRQEAAYPTSGHVVIHLDPSRPTKFPLQLRIPRWCQKATVAVNGQPWQEPIAPGEFLSIERQWSEGDRVTLDMPMPWRLVSGRKQQSGRAAVMRGPVVFCLNPTQNESLRKQDAVKLDIMIDPTSPKDLLGIDAVRPGSMACQVKASGDLDAVGGSGNLSLRLTEFPDPGGKAVYFRLPDLSVATQDELLSDDSALRPRNESFRWNWHKLNKQSC